MFGVAVNLLTFRGVLTKIASAMTTKTDPTGTTNPTARAQLRYVIGPLAGQAISGTVKGQMRGRESNAGANATLALAIKLIQPDGTDRSILLAQTASDSATAGHELTTTLTNMSFQNAAEVAAIPFTPQTATAGDYLVIELGFRSATGTSRNIDISYGDDSATDLPEDTSTTAANNPWIEFSGTIAMQSTGTASVSAAPATASGSATNVGNYIGTAAITVGAATEAGSATNVVPVYTGDGAVVATGATVAGSATFAPPVYTATAAITASKATATATGTFVAPSIAIGTASVTVGAATVAGTGVFGYHPVAKITQPHYHLSGRRYSSFSGREPASGTYTASASLLVGAATATAAGTFETHPVVKITQQHYYLSGRRYGSFASKTLQPYTGTAAIIVGAATVAGVGSAPAVPAIGTISVSIGATTAVALAAFGYHPAIKITQGTYALRSKRYGTFADKLSGPFTAASSVTVGAATAAGVGSVTLGVFTASANVTVATTGILGSGNTSFTAPGDVTADGAVTVGAATASASAGIGEHPVAIITQLHYHLSGKRYSSFAGKGAYTATAALTTGPATASGLASLTPPVYVGAGVVTVGAAAISGTAAKGLHPVRKITQSHYHLSGRRYGSFANKPAHTSSGAGGKVVSQPAIQRVLTHAQKQLVYMTIAEQEHRSLVDEREAFVQFNAALKMRVAENKIAFEWELEKRRFHSIYSLLIAEI